jgi:hypothetical protein
MTRPGKEARRQKGKGSKKASKRKTQHPLALLSVVL